MSRGLKIAFSVAFAVFVVLAFVGAVNADDDFEIPQQYNSDDFESDTDTEVSEVEEAPQDDEDQEPTPEETPEAEQDQEPTPEATPEAEQDQVPTPEATLETEQDQEPTPEATPEATISDLITNLNHISDGLHADNIHLMLIICIGLGILLGFLIMTKIF